MAVCAAARFADFGLLPNPKQNVTSQLIFVASTIRVRRADFTAVPLLPTEPWVRGASGAAGEPQDQLPHGGHDGSRPTDHHPRQARVRWLHRQHRVGAQVLHALQALRGAAHQTGATSTTPTVIQKDVRRITSSCLSRTRDHCHIQKVFGNDTLPFCWSPCFARFDTKKNSLVFKTESKAKMIFNVNFLFFPHLAF